MASIFAFTSAKGGSGKSCILAKTAMLLAANQKKTLILECTMGLRCQDLYLKCENQVFYHLKDVLDDICEPEDALVEISPYLYYLAAAQTLSCEDLSVEQLSGLLELYRPDFDIVLLDIPSGTDSISKGYALCAEECIVCMMPDPVSVRCEDKLLHELEQIKLGHVRYLINRADEHLAGEEFQLTMAETIELFSREPICVFSEADTPDQIDPAGILSIAEFITGEKLSLPEPSVSAAIAQETDMQPALPTVPLKETPEKRSVFKKLTQMLFNR